MRRVAIGALLCFYLALFVVGLAYAYNRGYATGQWTCRYV